jgi:hypothetical protein
MKRAVRTLIRLVAAGFLVFGGMTIGLEFARRSVPNAEAKPSQFVLGGILLAGGLVLLVFSGRLAERLADDFED